MTRGEAMRLLGLDESALTPADVRMAFARAVRAAHPDTADCGAVKHTSIVVLQDARDMLLSAIEVEKNACKMCDGRGKVQQRWGWRECSACGGSGDKS